MDKTLLTDLKRKMFIRSAMLSIPSLNEILGLNDYLSADEILLEIIKEALREFEHTNPLILEMRVNKDQMCSCDNMGLTGYCEIKSNFTLFLDCRLAEDQIILVPNSLPQYRISTLNYPGAGSYTYFTDYKRPYVYMEDVPNTSDFYIRGICSRPIIPDFLPDRSFNSDSSRSAIYWMNIEEGSRGVYFMDLCMVHLLDFLRNMKGSLILPGASIEIFGNLDSAYSELRARCDNWMLQSGWYGDLLV